MPSNPEATSRLCECKIRWPQPFPAVFLVAFPYKKKIENETPSITREKDKMRKKRGFTSSPGVRRQNPDALSVENTNEEKKFEHI